MGIVLLVGKPNSRSLIAGAVLGKTRPIDLSPLLGFRRLNILINTSDILDSYRLTASTPRPHGDRYSLARPKASDVD